jgi:hypothetical protein
LNRHATCAYYIATENYEITGHGLFRTLQRKMAQDAPIQNGFHPNGHVGLLLSNEALVLRALLRAHISRQLSRCDLQVPTTLLNNVNASQAYSQTLNGQNLQNGVPQNGQNGQNGIAENGNGENGYAENDDIRMTYTDLDQIFHRVAANFESRCHEQIERSLQNVPITQAAIENEVLAVVNNVLVDARVDWGRLMAVVAFVTYVALQCSRNEMPQAIEPLIDYTARLADTHFVEFIRQHGGWVRYLLQFRYVISYLGNDVSFISP